MNEKKLSEKLIWQSLDQKSSDLWNYEWLVCVYACSSVYKRDPQRARLFWENFYLVYAKSLNILYGEYLLFDKQYMKLYDLSIHDTKWNIIQMKDFAWKVILIVNTATKCGFAYQFDGLEKLHQKYKDKGLVVLGFPCNQFLSQEPESNESMENSCKINFGVTFPLTEKIEVIGDKTHPIFKHLKDSISNGIFGSSIKWNFTKFLVDTTGKTYKRYSPNTKPENIEKDIIKLLKNRD